MVHRQPPGAVQHFTGRTNELELLTKLVDQGAGRTVVISAIDGTAGIGKVGARFGATLRLIWQSVGQRNGPGPRQVQGRAAVSGQHDLVLTRLVDGVALAELWYPCCMAQ